MSREWFNKQSIKARPKKIENIYIKTKEEVDIMNNNKILTVSVDAGKGYTKWAYAEEVVGVNKEGKQVTKDKWITGIELSSVKKGEADFGSTTYINGEPYNFNGTIKMVEHSDKSKDNDEHKALMQKTLFDISLETGIEDFNVIMCISLDQFKVEENVIQMQKNMLEKEFTIKQTVKDKEIEKTIRIHNLVIEPEALVSTRYAKTKFKNVEQAVLVDIGTLNVGLVPLEGGRFEREDVTAPRIGYHRMIDSFKEYADSHKTNYSKKLLSAYVDRKQGQHEELDKLFSNFFKEKYAPLLKEEINNKGFGEFATLVFLGGTSSKCKDLIEENFKEYEGIEVITDIFATAKGAYKKGIKDLEKIKGGR